MSKMSAVIPDLLCKQCCFYYDGNKSITMQTKEVMMEVLVCIFSMDPVRLFMSKICIMSPGALSVSSK